MGFAGRESSFAFEEMVGSKVKIYENDELVAAKGKQICTMWD